MTLVVTVAVQIINDEGATVVSVGRIESVLPLEIGAAGIAKLAGERAHRLMETAGEEVDRQVQHLDSLIDDG